MIRRKSNYTWPFSKWSIKLEVLRNLLYASWIAYNEIYRKSWDLLFVHKGPIWYATFFYRNTYTKNSATYFSPLSLLFFNRSNWCCKKTSIELLIAIETRVLIPMIQSKFLWKQNSNFSQRFHNFMN